MRHRRTLVHLGAVSELSKKHRDSLEVLKKGQFETEGSAPGFEAPTLLESLVKQGSTRYMWWTSAEPKMAVSVTFVTNKVNPFFGANQLQTSVSSCCANIRNLITCVNAGLYLDQPLDATLPASKR